MSRIRVIHIVPMLSPGGAERVAVHIVNGLNRERFEPIVISFADPMNCDLDELLSQAGGEVLHFSHKKGMRCPARCRTDRAPFPNYTTLAPTLRTHITG